jgi:phosphoenolpyruvate synthase/pyruvate phosphate dikinase
MPDSPRKSETARPQLPTCAAGPLSVRTATTRLESYPQESAYPTEHRNLTSRQALLYRIATEYEEMPGLCLTAAQAQRRDIEHLTRGYADKGRYFVDRLAEGVARVAAAFWPKDVIVRLSDFKTNEYAGLLGGGAFEPKERT